MSDRIDDFVALLTRTPGVRATVDRSDDPAGMSFIDISGVGVDTHVSFQPAVGFGLFLGSDEFGQKPDVLIEDPALAAQRILSAVARSKRSEAVAGE